MVISCGKTCACTLVLVLVALRSRVWCSTRALVSHLWHHALIARTTYLFKLTSTNTGEEIVTLSIWSDGMAGSGVAKCTVRLLEFRALNSNRLAPSAVSAAANATVESQMAAPLRLFCT